MKSKDVMLSRDDLQRIQKIIEEKGDKKDQKYVKILQTIIEGMCHDDGIVSDGYSTILEHGV